MSKRQKGVSAVQRATEQLERLRAEQGGEYVRRSTPDGLIAHCEVVTPEGRKISTTCVPGGEEVALDDLELRMRHTTKRKPTAAEGDSDMATKKTDSNGWTSAGARSNGKKDTDTKVKAKAATKTAEPKAKAKAKAEPKAKKQKVDITRAKLDGKTVAGFKRDAKITLLVKKNPKRPGSASAQRYELYKKAKTVDEYLKLGGHSGDLQWDVNHKFIKIG